MVNSKIPNKVPLSKFDEAYLAFDRIHIKILGAFRNKITFVIIDAYSKCLEVYEISTDSSKTLRKLRDYFDKYGSPDVIISDNGTQLFSTEFETFCGNNRTVPNNHPATNGAVENIVKNFKNSLTKYFQDPATIHKSVSNIVSKLFETAHISVYKDSSVNKMCLRRNGLSL